MKVRLAWLLWASAIALAIAYLFHASPARAEGADCEALGNFARRMVTFRDVGADLNKMKLALRKDAPLGAYGATWPQLERILVRVFKDPRAGDDVAQAVFMQCVARLGVLGEDS